MTTKTPTSPAIAHTTKDAGESTARRAEMLSPSCGDRTASGPSGPSRTPRRQVSTDAASVAATVSGTTTHRQVAGLREHQRHDHEGDAGSPQKQHADDKRHHEAGDEAPNSRHGGADGHEQQLDADLGTRGLLGEHDTLLRDLPLRRRRELDPQHRGARGEHEQTHHQGDHLHDRAPHS